ncbi:helix-turn-helix transcriptional regulator [Streptomyces spiralis]|nr:helix-turn-helix transcriptional regulator [Streptomyces spiralis]
MAALGEFLRSRRASLRPEDVGLHAGGRRRVSGLRREEIAMLAGVSLAYYTRLEQGVSGNASDAVLDALADALRLDQDERRHLRTLARPEPKRVRATPPERVRDGIRVVLDSLCSTPAIVLGRNLDILAWNPLGHAFLAAHLDFRSVDTPRIRPNLARLVFLDPHFLDLFADWSEKARDTVAYLNLVAGRNPDDARLSALIGELTLKNRYFADLWAARPVSECLTDSRTYWHPLVGRLELGEEVMQLTDSGQSLVVYTAESDSPSREALEILQKTNRA